MFQSPSKNQPFEKNIEKYKSPSNQFDQMNIDSPGSTKKKKSCNKIVIGKSKKIQSTKRFIREELWRMWRYWPIKIIVFQMFTKPIKQKWSKKFWSFLICEPKPRNRYWTFICSTSCNYTYCIFGNLASFYRSFFRFTFDIFKCTCTF